MRHLIEVDGRVFSPDGKEVDVAPDTVAEVNAHADAAELDYWRTKPDQFSPAYYSFPIESSRPNKVYRHSFMPDLRGARVNTWSGSMLGTISYANVWHHNFGGRMVSIIVRGNNGSKYHGTASYDNGDVIRLRKNKRP